MSGDVVARYKLVFKDLASKGVIAASARMKKSLKQIAIASVGTTGAVTSISTAAFKLSSAVAARGDEFAKFGKQVDFSSQTLQKLEYVANRQGASFEKVKAGIQTFTKRMGELRKGTGALYSGLRKLDPQFAKQLKKTKSNEEAYSLMIKKVASLKTAQQRAALASAAFSKQSGTAVIRIARDGMKNVEELLKRAAEIRPPLTKKELAESEAFSDSLYNSQQALASISDAIGSQLLSPFTDVLNLFTEFVVANRDLIKAKAQKYFKQIANYLKSIDFKKVGKGITDFISKVIQIAGVANTAISAIGGMGNALFYLFAIKSTVGITNTIVGIATVFKKLPSVINPVIKALGSVGRFIAVGGWKVFVGTLGLAKKAVLGLGSAVWTLTKALGSVGKFIAVGAWKGFVGTLGLAKKAVLGLGSAVWTLTKALGSVGKFIAVGAWKGFVGTLGLVRNAVVLVGTAIRAALLTNPVGLIITALAGLVAVGVAVYKNWDTIKAYWNDLCEVFKNSDGVFSGIWNVYSKVWGDMLGVVDNFLTELFPFWGDVKKGFSDVWNVVSKTATVVWDNLVKKITGWVDTITTKIQGFFKKIKELKNSVSDYVGNKIDSAVDSVKEFGKGAKNVWNDLFGDETQKTEVLKTLNVNNPKMSDITKNAMDTAQKVAEIKAEAKVNMNQRIEITGKVDGAKVNANVTNTSYKSSGGGNAPVSMVAMLGG